MRLHPLHDGISPSEPIRHAGGNARAQAATAVPRPRVQLTPREIAELVIREADRADSAEAEADALKPDAMAWRTLASGEGDYSVGDAAKLLSRHPAVEIGMIRLFAFLELHGWIYRDKGDGAWRVYQAQIDAGRMNERAQSHRHPRTGELLIDPPQVRITVDGLKYLSRLFDATLPLEAVWR